MLAQIIGFLVMAVCSVGFGFAAVFLSWASTQFSDNNKEAFFIFAFFGALSAATGYGAYISSPFHITLVAAGG